MTMSEDELHDLRQTLAQSRDRMAESATLAATTVHSLKVKDAQLKGLAAVVESIDGWDFLGKLPKEWRGKLVDQHARVADIEGKANASVETLVTMLQRLGDPTDATEDHLAGVKTMLDGGVVEVTEGVFRDAVRVVQDATVTYDAAVKAITDDIVKTAKDAVLKTQDMDLKAIEDLTTAVGSTISAIEAADPDLVSSTAFSGLNTAVSVLGAAIGKAVLEYKKSHMSAEDAFAKTGDFTIAEGHAKDVMSVVKVFLAGFDAVIPKFSLVEGALEGAIESFVYGRVTKANYEQAVAAKGEEGFWSAFGTGLQATFADKATELLAKLVLPSAAIQETITILVKAFADQVVKRMPLTPAQKHPGVQLHGACDDLKNAYATGLALPTDEVLYHLAEISALSDLFGQIPEHAPWHSEVA
jgi:hypothetical protein